MVLRGSLKLWSSGLHVYPLASWATSLAQKSKCTITKKLTHLRMGRIICLSVTSYSLYNVTESTCKVIPKIQTIVICEALALNYILWLFEARSHYVSITGWPQTGVLLLPEDYRHGPAWPPGTVLFLFLFCNISSKLNTNVKMSYNIVLKFLLCLPVVLATKP